MRRVEWVLRRLTLPVLIVVGVVTTVPGNWLRVQNFDPQFSMGLVQRTMHFGGTFFDNGIQDHGPIEPFLYDIAARLGGRNGAWYLISAMVTLVSLGLGFVGFGHFTIWRSNYAGVFYIRNMTTILLAGAWLLLIENRAWASPRRRR